jgi:hypothetical protein
MKKLIVENPFIAEIDALKNNAIQGLYSVRGAHESFWSLKVKIELSVFKKQNGEVKP